MRIVAKSAPIEQNIRAKLDTTRFIEIQLLEHLSNINQIQDIMHVLEMVPEADILCIHTPITKLYECSIDNYINPITYDDLMYTSRLAAKIAEKENHSVKMVVHAEISYRQISEQKEMIEKGINTPLFQMSHLIRKILINNNVELCIENVTPTECDGFKILRYRNGNYFENCMLADTLRSYADNSNIKDRIHTCLDICHLKTTLSMEGLLYAEYPEWKQAYTMEDWFIENSPYIGLVHLNDVIRIGMIVGEHGSVCTDETLLEFVELYKKYNWNCDITLEVMESNYLVCNNFKKLYHRLFNALKNDGIVPEI